MTGQKPSRFALPGCPAGLAEPAESGWWPQPSRDRLMNLIGFNRLLGVSNFPSMLHTPHWLMSVYSFGFDISFIPHEALRPQCSQQRNAQLGWHLHNSGSCIFPELEKALDRRPNLIIQLASGLPWLSFLGGSCSICRPMLVH